MYRLARHQLVSNFLDSWNRSSCDPSPDEVLLEIVARD